VHPDDVAHAAAVRAHAVAARSLYEVEYRLRRADGEYRHFWVRGVPVFDGDVTCSSGLAPAWISPTVSGPKRSGCSSSASSNRARGWKAWGARRRNRSRFHNILMAVLGYADLAMADLPLTAPARDNVKEIARAARRAAELCRRCSPIQEGTLRSRGHRPPRPDRRHDPSVI